MIQPGNSKTEFREELTDDLLAPSALERLEQYGKYSSALPFPHIVIDDLFQKKALESVLAEWPTNDSNMELHNDGTFVKEKVGTTWQTAFGTKTKQYFNELASPPFLLALEKLTGMWGLMGDAYMFGGGLHATAPGGSLAVHADFNKHPRFGLDRRLNMLIYLNKNWTDANGGHLELWDEEMQSCKVRVLPTFNRTVIFSTNKTSYHGQPNPVAGAHDLRRRSMAFYYYSNGRADEGSPPNMEGEHTTLWQKRQGTEY